MKRYYFIIFLFFLVISLSAVNASDVNPDSCNSTLAAANDSVSSSIEIPDNDLKASSSYYNLSGSSTDKKTNNAVSKISAKDVTATYGNPTKFQVTVLDKKGKAIENQSVKFKVNNKVYNVFTNSSGVAKIYLNLSAGNYPVTYSSGGISGKKNFKVKNAYSYINYKWNSGGVVTKNKKIKANLPDSALVRKMVYLAKSGTPVVKFQGGNGKVVLITAGVNGNELSSQIAALKLIKHLESNPINGTVYIMPFMHPKATEKNVRDYNIKLNRNANVKGTISYKTVQLIVKYKCDAYGDFHCTKPGGVPGKNVAMGTYNPTGESATIAKYIAKKSNVKCLIYNEAGVEYPGALEDVVSLKGIPAVTCEVIAPRGTIVSGSVSKSLSMMKSLLNYCSIL